VKTGAKHTKTSGPKSVLSRNALAVVHVQAYQVTTISQATIPTISQVATISQATIPTTSQVATISQVATTSQAVISQGAIPAISQVATMVATMRQATIPTMRQAATSGEELVDCAMSPNGMNQACRCATAPLGLNSVLGLGV